MPRVVASSEVQNNFGSILRWAEEHGEDVVVERRGRPAAVIISYAEYEEIERLRQEQRTRQALAAIRQVREQVQSRVKELTADEAYRLAGLSEPVIAEVLAAEEEGGETKA